MSTEASAPSVRAGSAPVSPPPHTLWTARALDARIVPMADGRRAVMYTIGQPDTWDPDAVDHRGRKGLWIRSSRTSGLWCGPGSVPAAWDTYRRRWVAAERAATDRDDAAALVVGIVEAVERAEDERRELVLRDLEWRAAHGAGPTMAPRDRAERYLEHLEPSVAGQGGASALMRAAFALAIGFALPAEAAIELLAQWDAAHSAPPWGRRECMRAVRSALRRGGELGYLLTRDRRAA